MNSDTYTRYEDRLVKSADGTEICADAIGNRSPECPVIVLIHGFAVVKEAFDPLFEDPKWVQNTFLVRYDARGFGRSGKPLNDEAWDYRRNCEDFEAVCKEFGVQKAIVLGWSLGATYFPDIVNYVSSVEITGLIAVEGPPSMEENVIARVATAEAIKTLGNFIRPATVDIFQETALHFVRLCSDAISTDLCRILLEGIFLQPRSIAARVVERKQETEGFWQDAREGKLDILVLTGGKDKLIDPEGLGAMYGELGWKNYTLAHVEEADHVPWLSGAEKFRDAVLGWAKTRV